MPRSKVGKKREKVNVERLTKAVEDCMNEGISLREAVRRYEVSKTTLIRHLLAFKNSESQEFVYSATNKTKQVFSPDEEESLKTYLITAARLHYGLTKVEVRSLAYQYASAKGKAFPDNWNKEKMAGKEWLRQFMKRQTDLSLRKPEPTSLARSTAFNQVNVKSFFKNYKEILSRRPFSPEQIWNIDETGISTVHVPPKIISPKGVKQVGQMTSGERGQNVTLIAAINALGNAIPPMMIFPRVHFKANMIKGCPVGTIGKANPSGWSNSDLFFEFMQHLKNHVNATPDKQIIILLDNHDSHISIPTIDYCKENGIILLTFHPHTSHKMQPLDRTVFGPLKSYYNTACSEWMLMHPGQPITIYDVAELIGKAFPQAFTPVNIQKGFQVTGLYPFNENIFQEHEFLTSYVTDRPLIENPNSNAAISSPPIVSFTPAFASTSSDQNQSLVTPEILRPFPKAPERKKSGGRPKGKSRILTDTPEKEELEQKRNLKGIKTVKRQLVNKVKVTKKKEELDSSEGESLPSLSSSEDETLEEIISKDKGWMEINTLQQMNQNDEICRGDFVLIKLAGKKTVKYFIGEILNIGDNNEIRYLRRIKETNKFVNDSVDSYDFSPADVICKLPPPERTKGTARQCSTLCFSVSFDGYQVN